MREDDPGGPGRERTAPGGYPADPYAGLIARAEGLLDLRRPADAVPLLDQAARLQPQALRPQALLARAFLDLGDRPCARAAIGRAIAIDPGHEWPHRLASILSLREGKKPEALAAREASRLGPEIREALYLLGTTQLACAQRAEAQETAVRLVGAHPSYVEGHRLLGDVALAEKAWQRAEAHFRQALALEPQHLVALNNLAVALQRQGREEEAYALFEQAARQDPSSELGQSNLYRAMQRRFRVLRIPPQFRLIGAGAILIAVPQLAGVLLLLAAAVAFDRAVLVPRRLAASSPGLAAFYRHQRKRERERARASRSPRARLNRLLFAALVLLIVLLVAGLLVVAIGSR